MAKKRPKRKPKIQYLRDSAGNNSQVVRAGKVWVVYDSNDAPS